jgi:hypothetical protein
MNKIQKILLAAMSLLAFGNMARATDPDASTVLTTATTAVTAVETLVVGVVGFFIIVRIVKWVRK